MSVKSFLKEHAVALDVFSSYACADAPRFLHCINPEQKVNVMNRFSRAQDRKARGVGAAAAFNPGTAWNAPHLKQVYERVTAERYGECTTFAKAAGHVLTLGKGAKPRIEIVAFSNHVFLVVGRTAGSKYEEAGEGFRKRRQLPQWGGAWGNDWAIVDPWAGSMGYPDIIYLWNGQGLGGGNTGGDYPFEAMLHPIHLVMERPAGN